MLTKNKYIVIVFSFVIISALIYFSYKAGEQDEYAGFSLFIRYIFWYLIAIGGGTAAIIVIPQKKTFNSTVLLIILGTLNVLLATSGLLFNYIISQRNLDYSLIFFCIPLLLGLVIFRKILLTDV